MISKGKRPRDTNQLAKWVVDRATGQIPTPDPNEGKSPAAVKRGRAGGLKGGKTRAANLSSKRRKEIAKSAATARWQRQKKSVPGTAE
jgi:hypothetical protein